MKYHQWLLLVLVVLFTGLLLGGCTGAATPTTAPPTEEPKGADTTEATEKAPETEEAVETEAAGPSGKVSLWHSYHTDGAEEATLAELIESAKTQFPNMEIEVLQVPFDQLFNKYQTEVAAGGGPDMFVAPNDDLGNWVRGAFVENLDSYVTADDLAGVTATGVDGMKVDGSLYGIPESAKAVALYYNKSLVETPPTTADELLQQVKDGAQMTFILGAYHMYGWAGIYGGKLLDENGVCIADQGGWVEGLQFLLDLKEAGAVFASDETTVETPFRNGETAFYVNGPWILADYKEDLGNDLGVAVIDGFLPLNGIDGYHINPNSQNKEAAVALALFLTSCDQAQAYTDKAGHVPIRDTVVVDDPLVAAFADASAKGFPRPQSEEFANYWVPFGDMFTKVIEGVMTPEEAVAEACAAMNTANEK
ncbi:MAG: extracellular solute-binding protein [Anaerolineae bacterium]|nr:extracellular solute-binding protein [Anaerolineae bacterium]